MVEHNYLEEDKNIVDLSDESSEGEEATLVEEQIFRIGDKEVHVSYDPSTDVYFLARVPILLLKTP